MMLLWLLFASALGQCVRDVYTNLPAAPAFPSATYSTTDSPSTFVQNHWSQVVTLLRPANTVNNTQSNCPHLQSGLVDWHDPTIWGGSLPANNTNVTLPVNKTVLVSRCSISPTYIFNYVTVPVGSSLVFGDAPIIFQARGMIVQGKFLAGSPTCRLRNKLNITLHGTRPAVVPAPPYVKGIQVTGQIDLHAVEYFPTWTRLAKTAWPGNSTIFIQDCPNWQPGQSIVITTTELKDARDFNRNEQVVISSVKKVSSVSANTCAVTLTAPLLYKHYGGFEYQAEVGLLSRNFLVQGAADSEPTDTARTVCNSGIGGTRSTYACPDQYLTGWGAHVMVMGSGVTAGRFSGIEGYRVGQTNALARYPFHWHLVGNITTPGAHFASDCSVHHSFFRCFTIHGTSGTSLATGVKLTKNVGYDVIGHCYFCSEDGMEENNTISYNLGAHIHLLGPYWETSEGVVSSQYSPQNSNGAQSFGSQYTNWVYANSQLVLADDVGASPFYFTNAYVQIFGNAASGGWAGYSFPNLKSPVGASASQTWFVPKNRPLLLFKGNSAHSTGFWQSHASGVYLGGNLHLDNATAPNSSFTATIYTVGRDLPARDTCTDNRYGGLVVTAGCPAANQVWLRFEDTKVFLANAGLQSWGNREEIVRFEVHDCGLSTNVFGQVWIDQMLVNSRTGHAPTYLSGCNITGTTYNSCNARDTTWFKNYNGFQFYDTGQSHLVTNSIFQNCMPGARSCATHYPNTGCVGTPPSTSCKVWTYLTHSDQFTPGMMQQTSNVTYVNVDLVNSIMASSTSERYVSVSGKAANWFDADGSIVPALGKKGKRVNIGSNWTNDWWKFGNYPQCNETYSNWICELYPGDSVASVIMHWNTTAEPSIGSSTCSNGARISPANASNNWGYYPCPQGAMVTHFGSVEGQASYNVSLMSRVSGPLIAAKGGWFVRHFGGTPVNISFTDMQIKHDDIMLLAIPYPNTTKFNIYGRAPSWCNPASGSRPICVRTYRAVSSVSEVRAAWGDAYFFDTKKSLLYIRIVELSSFPSYFGLNATYNQSQPWNSTTTKNNFFARGGLQILVTGSSSWAVVIEATNCGAVNGRCALPSVSVPDALTAVPAPVNSPIPAPVTVPVALNLRVEDSEQGSQNTGALIGGIIGGVVALVLVGLIVAFVVLNRGKSEGERV